MAKKPKVSYNRAPSEELLNLLMPGGNLSWLVELGKEKVAGYQHDVHFRTGDEVQIYRGGTKILSVQRLKDGRIKVPGEIDEAYKKQLQKFGLCRTCDANDLDFQEKVMHFLDGVKVAKKWIQKEGLIQIQWSQATNPWTPFDREAVLKGPHQTGASFPQVKKAIDALGKEARESGWVKPPEPKDQGELDKLAIDSKGRLVLLELKDAWGEPHEVYYAPFQLLQYVWEWQNVLYRVQDDLQKIIDARQSVRLMPKNVPNLTGGIRAAVGFGYDPPRGRNERERKYKYKKVLKIVNCHLPPGINSIETWAWSDDGPYCLGW